MEQTNPAREPGPVLAVAEAQRRADLLGVLKDALAERSVESLLVTRRRIVLRAKRAAGPSGPTDPALYVFSGDGSTNIVTTDGTDYHLPCGVHPVDDLGAVVAAVRR